MKVGLCVIVKNENKYIQEFIDHYINIGIDTIFIYDNNDIDGEQIILNNYDNIIIENIRGKHAIQFSSYMDCYKKYKNDYDWICFFDCDEFLYLNDESYKNNIKNYLSDPIFNGFNEIKINWKIYGDNDIEQLNDNYSITRFKEPVMPLDFKSNYDFPQNNHCKVIIRCLKDFNALFYNPHFCHNILNNKICKNNGDKGCNGPFEYFNYDKAELRHYYTKTITEYIEKIDRGWPDVKREFSINQLKYNLNLFFKYNKRTLYKETEINTYLNNKYNQILKIYVCAHKEFDKSIVPNLCHEITYVNNCNNDLNDFKVSLSEGYQIYEIYKNKDIQNYEFIGICHYRRYYNLYIDDLIEKLYKHDIIVIKKEIFNGLILYEQYDSCFNKEDLDVIKNIINEYTPEYNDAYDRTMKQHYMYCYNMSIMKTEDFIKYCDWIFLILNKFCEYHSLKNDNDITAFIKHNKHKISNINNPYIDPYFSSIHYCSRILGHLMERLMNVYINKNFNNIYEVPLKFIDNKDGFILNVNNYYK